MVTTNEHKKMNPSDWKEEYEDGVPHWAEDKNPSKFAQEFLKDMQEKRIYNVLEVGCGNGRDSILFAHAGIRVTSIDITPKAIELAEENAEKAEVKITFKVANAEKLPFNRSLFGAYYSLSVLHSTNLKKSIREASRVLKTGGLAFIYIYGDTEYADGKKEDTITLDKYVELLSSNKFKFLDVYTEQEEDFDEFGEKHNLFVAKLQKG